MGRTALSASLVCLLALVPLSTPRETRHERRARRDREDGGRSKPVRRGPVCMPSVLGFDFDQDPPVSKVGRERTATASSGPGACMGSVGIQMYW